MARALAHRGGGPRAARREPWETLDFFEIDHLATEHAGNLSGGQRKLLEMARALMTDPEVVLLDDERSRASIPR